MNKTEDNITYYELSPSQAVIMYQQKFCISKNVVQVPFYFLTERKVDLEIMKRAILEEIKRNDAFAIRYKKIKGKLYEYFIKDPPANMKCYAFKSQKEQDDVLQKDATAPLVFLKDDTYRIVLFSRWDGKFGVYINAHHTIMDAMGVHIFFNDLCKVYDALALGTEMPKPLDKFEESLKRDLECAANTAKRESDMNFWRETFAESDTTPYYAGFEGPHRLDKARKKNPKMTTTNIVNPLNENAGLTVREIPGELVSKIREVCLEGNLTVQDFVQTAMRIYLSATNHDCGDVTFIELCSRRAKLADRNCSGCRCHAVYTRTIFDDNDSYINLASKLAKRQLQVYRHADLGTLDLFDVEHKCTHNPVINTAAATMFTYIPRAQNPNDLWRKKFGGYNPGKFAYPMYTFCSESGVDDSITCRYIYRTFIFTEQNMLDFHNGTVNILRAAIEDPERTVGELKKKI